MINLLCFVVSTVVAYLCWKEKLTFSFYLNVFAAFFNLGIVLVKVFS